MNSRSIATLDPELDAIVVAEEQRPSSGFTLIPSENHTDPEVLALLGSVLTDKYAEGYPGRRYCGGQVNYDALENIARDRAKALFRGEHANVQPLSGSPMNQAVYLGLLQPGDTILAMDLSHGGHLTHGDPVSHMGRLFKFVRYKTLTDSAGAIDFDGLAAAAKEHRPKLLICGHSSYPRALDYAAFKRVADDVGALTMADVSHIGGLIAAGVAANPLDAGFDILTTTTHKTLRGPRGGLIVCRAAFAKAIDKSVFPGLQGGPHMNTIAAAAFTFRKAAGVDFRAYAARILDNARALAEALRVAGAKLITGGTENHLMVLDTVATAGVDGDQVQKAFDQVGLVVNKQIIPDDSRPPLKPSGIRIGTPALTTRGLKPADMPRVADWVMRTIRAAAAKSNSLADIAGEVEDAAQGFPVPGLAA